MPGICRSGQRRWDSNPNLRTGFGIGLDNRGPSTLARFLLQTVGDIAPMTLNRSEKLGYVTCLAGRSQR